MAKRRGNGEGTIRKRSNGTWEGMINFGVDENGKTIRKSVYAGSQSEIIEKVRNTISDHSRGKVLDGDKSYFFAWANTVYEQYKKPKLKPSSCEIYEHILNKRIKSSNVDVPLKDLTTLMLQSFFNKLAITYSDESLRRMKNFMNGCLLKAVETRIIMFNPMDGVELPKGTKENCRGFDYLDEDEHRDIIDYLLNTEDDLKLQAALLFIIGTGVRIGEAAGLKWSLLDLRQQTAKIVGRVKRENIDNGTTKTALVYRDPKTESGIREVPIPDFCISSLRAWKIEQAEKKLLAGGTYLDEGYVFTTDFGTPLDPRNFNRALHRMLSRAGIRDVNVHALRHSYATRLLELGENPKTAADLLGHSNVTTVLNKYSHVTMNTKKKAASKFNALLR